MSLSSALELLRFWQDSGSRHGASSVLWWAISCATGAVLAVRTSRRRIRRVPVCPVLGAQPRVGRRLPLLRREVTRLTPLERAGLAAGALLVVVQPALAAVVLCGALASVLAERAQARRAQTLAHRAEVRSGIAAVAAALRAGLPPATAWASIVSGRGMDRHSTRQPDAGGLLGPVAAAARLGLDVPAALEDASLHPGADALRRVAVCCRVTEGAGSGLAGALERLVESLQDDEELRGTVAAELSSAQSTGRLLAALPVLGIAGAAALGTPPQALLLDTAVGRACSLAAAVLEVSGLLWIRRLAASVR